MIEFTLIFGLFLPRLALLIGWFASGILPNSIPFFLDFLLAFFAPRLLFVIYIASNWDTLPGAGWYMFFHLTFMILSWIGRSLKDDGNKKYTKYIKYS